MENKKAVIIFSIDDGKRDTYRLAKELLIPMKVPATLNIVAKKSFSGAELYVSQEELSELSGYPFIEIANHSANHTNEYDDIRDGFLMLCKNLGMDETKTLGFASPCSKMSVEYIRDNTEELKKLGVSYVRTCQKDYFNRQSEDRFALTSYAAKFDTPIEDLINLAECAVQNNYCLIYLFHSILKKEEAGYGGTWTYDYEKFTQLVSYVKELEQRGCAEIKTTSAYVKKRSKMNEKRLYIG